MLLELPSAILVHCASFCNLTCALGPAASCKGLRIACVTAQRESTQLTLDNADDACFCDEEEETGVPRTYLAARLERWAARTGGTAHVTSLTLAWVRNLMHPTHVDFAPPRIIGARGFSAVRSFALVDTGCAEPIEGYDTDSGEPITRRQRTPSMFELSRSLTAVASQWPQLHTLKLRCTSLHNSHLRTIIAVGLPELQTLELTSAHLITSEGVNTVGACCDQLRMLALIDCVSVGPLDGEGTDQRPKFIILREVGAGCHLRCGCTPCYNCELNACFCGCEDEEEFEDEDHAYADAESCADDADGMDEDEDGCGIEPNRMRGVTSASIEDY